MMLDGSWNLSLIALALLQVYFICYFASQFLAKKRKKSSRRVYAVSVALWVITACLFVYLLFTQ